MPKPLVSVIITTKNSAPDLPRLLTSLSGQTYSRVETIVIDNHSTDSTLKIAKKFTSHVYTFGPERSSQRNFGAAKSSGKFLLFLDSDMQLTPKVISECVSEVTHPGIGGVIIPEISVGRNFWEKVQAFERSFYFSGNPDLEAARFFPRRVFVESGGYDETITGREDWDLSETVAKNGYQIARISAPLYHFERIPSLWGQLKKDFYYGLTSPRYVKKQNLSLISPKSIHFLRPQLYRDPAKLISHPLLTLGMFTMFFVQLFAGSAGYLTGKLEKN